MENLLNGIALIIDDEVNDKKAKNTANIIRQIENAQIPILKYESLPDIDTKHFQNLSFIMLDWRLIKQDFSDADIASGNILPDTILRYDYSENIDFLKKLNKFCFAPIFIFSNEDITEINQALESESLIDKHRPSNIFVKRKADLQGRTKVINEALSWISKNPSIYVLKKWEEVYQKSKNALFSDFQTLSSIWPKILWKNFSGDGVNPSLELGELITRNLETRMAPFYFDSKVINKRGIKIEKDEIKKVIEGERFVKSLDEKSIHPGDIFKIKKTYYINIRAICDLIPGRGNTTQMDDVDLYLLKGSKLTNNQAGKVFDAEYGLFLERDNQSIIFPINGGEILDFQFKKFEIKQWKELKDKRIGRLLPPFITKIQQRFSLYLHRQGLPKIPKEALK